MWRPERVYFGPAGMPTTVKKGGVIEGIAEVKRLGLDAMEIEFVRKIFLNEKSALDVKSAATQLGVVLTVHAPYYVNLNSDDGGKVKASIERVVESARIGYKAGAWSVCFHAGYYGNLDNKKTHEVMKERVKVIVKTLKDEGIEIWVRPETTGKPSQYGSLEEILDLSLELEMVLPVVDFAHLHARGKGAFKQYQDITRILELIEEKLGREGLENMHIHVSGIEYGEKGEIRHLNLQEADLDYKLLVKALKEFNVKGVIISESPNLEGDAILLRDLFYGSSRKRKSRKRESLNE
ncbi:MAG: TIM barrel protein [Infirmifilum sp.]|uniref:TIM barrel protein n=1 Tax=Infirmifilum TaxID=2856573 RepID=UPI003C783D50